MIQFTRKTSGAALSALVLAGLLPLAAHAGSAGSTRIRRPADQTSTVFTIGVHGGNIRPWTVTLAADGSVNSTILTVGDKHLPDGRNTVAGLRVLTKAEHFGALAPQTNCRGTLPDIASRYITYQGRTVSVHGTCNKRFNQLFSVLFNAADAQS